MGNTPSDEGQLVTEAETEATEIKDDIKEAKQEAKEARADGDTARAERLEQRVTGLEGKLDTVLEKLGKLVDRPFHPAPEERPADDQGRTGDGAAEKDEAPEPPADTAPPKKKGRAMNRKFFGSRVDED